MPKGSSKSLCEPRFPDASGIGKAVREGRARPEPKVSRPLPSPGFPRHDSEDQLEAQRQV